VARMKMRHTWQYSEVFLTQPRTKQTSKKGTLKIELL